MSEVLTDRGFESDELNKLVNLIRDRANNGIDQLRYTDFDEVICIVPYRKHNEKGYGSFYLSYEDFQILNNISEDIEFIKVGSIKRELERITLEAKSRIKLI